MTTVVAEQMKSKLLTLDQVQASLSSTEPLSQVPLEHSEMTFVLDPKWSDGLEAKAGTDLVDAFIDQSGTSFQMTKDCIQAACSAIGLNTAYTARTPAGLIEPQLNYWFRDGFSEAKSYKLLVLGDSLGAALTKDTINPFSNLQLLDQALDSIYAVYGKDAEVLVDYKFQHSLRSTVMRLVVPENVRAMVNTGTENDLWSTGIQIKNSLTGEAKTEISGYLFRWWCTNGATDTFTQSGVWSRRTGNPDEVYEWARTAVDEVLGGLEGSLDGVQELVDIPIQGEANEVLKDVFSYYKVPQATRDRILENMVEAEHLNMYSLMNAVTEVANGDDVDPRHASSLLAIGGELVHRAHDRCDGCHRLLDV